MRYLSSKEALSAAAPRAAVDALREVLKGGFDPPPPAPQPRNAAAARGDAPVAVGAGWRSRGEDAGDSAGGLNWRRPP